MAFRSPDGLDAWLCLHDLFPATTHAHAQVGGGDTAAAATTPAPAPAVVQHHICVIGSRVRLFVVVFVAFTVCALD